MRRMPSHGRCTQPSTPRRATPRASTRQSARANAAHSGDAAATPSPSVTSQGNPLVAMINHIASTARAPRLAAAACFLPLTANPELSQEFGTRHRAALGITEETDAVAVVVSEETGVISVVFDGEIVRDLDGKGLRNALYKYLISDVSPRTGIAKT